MKTCSKCKAPHDSQTDGYCVKCRKEYAHNYNAAKPEVRRVAAQKRRWRIQEAVRKAKDVPCTDCGVRYPYYIMQFDHINNDKEFAISTMARNYKRLSVVDAEISKCEVICANCHMERTHSRLQ